MSVHAKRPYEAPKLVVHGSVEAITQQVAGGKTTTCNDGNSGTQGNRSCKFS